MIGALDIDAAYKLSALRLFAEAMAAIEVTEVRVLAQAKFSAGSRMPPKRRRDRIARYGAEAVDAAARLFDSCLVIDEPSSEVLDVLSGFDAIDDGEKILIAATARSDALLFVTGDKRCLDALSAPELEPIRTALARRVVCIESVLLELIAARGFDWVRERVVPHRECDRAVAVAFGSGMRAEEPNVVAALEAALPVDRSLLWHR